MPPKLTHKFVFNYYKNNDYHMNSIYKGIHDKDNITCPVGHNINIKFNNFKNMNQRCSICEGNIKYTHKFVKLYLESLNYILLSEEYNNNKQKIIIRCEQGHIYKTNFDNFKNKEARCRTCYEINNRGEAHKSYNKDRTRKGRLKYLSFDLYKSNILKDDLNFNDYLINKNLYEIDHIFPRVAFIDNEFDKIYGEELCKKIANKRNNLRIIDQKYNSSKGGKYNQEEFMNWFTNELILEYTNI